jgi:uncharacterized protein YlxP (DUF503 family)
MPGNRSLKDKRMILKSLKDRIRNRFNVSIAEAGLHERWCSAQLAVVTVSADSVHAHQTLESVARYVGGHGEAVLADYHIQML